ncbi:MAG: sigma-70 family RNA polymerase sigma factor [Kofleriaceae bacterium]
MPRPVSAVGSDARRQLLAELAGDPARRGLAVAFGLLGNRGEAEDAVQDALARACERVGELRDPAAAPAWFLRIVTSRCLNVLRRRRLTRALLGPLAPRPPDDEGGSRELAVDHDPAPPLHGGEAPSPAAALAHRQELALLVRSLDDLPTKQRAALLLRYGQGLPVIEVAHLLAVEPATVKTHLVRGLARLRAHLENTP